MHRGLCMLVNFNTICTCIMGVINWRFYRITDVCPLNHWLHVLVNNKKYLKLYTFTGDFAKLEQLMAAFICINT